MNDRLGELLGEHDVLYCVICRDATLTDMELMAQEGYHVVWLDLEHGPQSTEEAMRLGRAVTHLGMVPLARIVELNRTHVQRLLDGGIQVITLPDVKDAEQAARLVELGKFPPLGQRGVATTGAGTGFRLAADPLESLREANEHTHLMVMFESDGGYDALDEILAIEEIDMISVGPMDWSVSLGLSGDEAKANLTPKIDHLVRASSQAGKIVAMNVATADQARHYRALGARVFLVGTDITLKRRALAGALAPLRDALGSS